MSRAANDILDKIHTKIAADMLARLESGQCEAKDWAVIVKFLKDNNIDAVPDNKGAGDAFERLIAAATASIGQHTTN